MVSGNDIQQLVWYTFEMFRLAFASYGSTPQDTTGELDRTIKLFLSMYTELDLAINNRSPSKNPLLSLPDMVR